MYGCFDCYVVFGFREKDRGSMISKKWFKKYIEDLNLDDASDLEYYAGDVVRLHCGNMVYGMVAYLNPKTGQAEVNEKQKEIVKKLYERVCRENEKRYSKLGFYKGIQGDFDTEHSSYNPDVAKPLAHAYEESEEEEDGERAEEDEGEKAEEGKREKGEGREEEKGGEKVEEGEGEKAEGEEGKQVKQLKTMA